MLVAHKNLGEPIELFVHGNKFWDKVTDTVETKEFDFFNYNSNFGNGGCTYEPNESNHTFGDKKIQKPHTKIELELCNIKSEIGYEKDHQNSKWYNQDDTTCPYKKDFDWSNEIKRINSEVFNNTGFRPMQLEIINSVISGNDTFALVPTGGGKTLCYQLPAIYSDGITLVISPLISLIQDQVQRLEFLNISCASFPTEQEYFERLSIIEKLRNAEIKVLFVTPEKIVSSKWFQSVLDELYSKELLVRFVIDEAHCISHWGSDFRPDYASLGVLRKCYPDVPILLLTATATSNVFDDLIRIMRLRNCQAFSCNFNRPNLKFKVVPKSRNTKLAIEELIGYVREYPTSSGIVYCLSCQDCEFVSSELVKSGINSMHYHAQLDQLTRKHVQQSWMEGSINVVVATLAFGMGIDKSNVRFVIHFSMPKSIENYFQEAGRAGRDGELATCIVMYDYKDSQRLLSLVKNGESIKKMLEYCENPKKCRREMLLGHFGQKLKGPCDVICDNCQAHAVATNCREAAYKVAVSISRLQKPHTLLNILKLATSRVKCPNGLKGCLTELKFTYEQAESLLHYMVIRGVLYEYLVRNEKFNTSNCYIRTSKDFNSKLYLMESLYLRGNISSNISGVSVKKRRKISSGDELGESFNQDVLDVIDELSF